MESCSTKVEQVSIAKLTWLVFCNKKIKLASQNQSMRAFLLSEDNEQTIDQIVILRAKFQMSFYSKEKRQVCHKRRNDEKTRQSGCASKYEKELKP